MKKFFIFLLVITALALFGVLCWALTEYYQWTPWLGLALFLGVAGLVLGFKFLRRLYASTRERLARATKPVSEVTGKEEGIKREGDLRARWRSAMDTLSKSSLRKKGNPVYVLPWYMVMGASNSGKTSALLRAQLSSPIKEVTHAAITEKTGTWDWWYFDNAVVIDTAGRYSVAKADEQVADEWRELMRLLAKSRSREPLNGVIVTVPADQLLYGERDAIADEARQIRGRIDQLMRLFDARIPIYVVITKCDLLYGMDVWSKNLPEKALQQAMGHVEEPSTRPPSEFLDRAFAGVVERLRDLRLLLVQSSDVVAAGLLLPNEFERLRPGLESFFGGAFGDSPYLEAPFLRGLFFTSARQQGGVSSFVLKDSGLPEQTSVLSGTFQGLFLHDVLDNIIPRDRRLAAPLGGLRRWKDATRNLGVASWLTMCAAAAIFLTLSFTNTLNTLSELKSHQPESGAFSGKFAPDLTTLAEYHQMVKWLETREVNWVSSFAPFHGHVTTLEQQLKNGFAERFQKYALNGLDQQTARRVRTIAQSDPDNVRTHYIQFVVRRLNLLKGRAANESAKSLYAMPSPSRTTRTLAIIQGDPEITDLTPEAANSFGAMYVSYLLWQKNLSVLKLETTTLNNWLNQFALQSDNLSWLTDWANEQPALSPVRLQEFWPGTRELDKAPSIQPAYTARGRAAIEQFLKEVQASAQANVSMSEKTDAFTRWYLMKRLDAWRDFAINFDVGKNTLDGEKEWRTLLSRMPSDINPYANLLTRLVSEFEDVRDDKVAPEWLTLARQASSARMLSEKSGFMASAGRVASVIGASGQQIVRDTVQAGPLQGGKAVIDKQLHAANAYTAYRAALAKAAKEEISGLAQAYKVASDFFAYGVDAEVKESLLHGANAALADLQTKVGKGGAGGDIVWSLLYGPLDFVIEYASYQAACHVQNEWQSKVLMPSQNIKVNTDVNDYLYGPKGILWGFADTTAKPFLRRTASQFDIAETLGHRVPISGLFPVLLNDGLGKRASQSLAQENAMLEQKQMQILAQRRQLAERQKQQETTGRQQEIEKKKLAVQNRLKAVSQALDERKKEVEALRGQVQTVVISGVPTNVNTEARAKPYSTVLTVQCAPGQKTLTNLNFPVAETINWSETTCGDTSVQIKIEDFTLGRRYPGPKGFLRFLDEFHDGKRAFAPADFPSERARLEQLGVDSIRVRYEFTGVEALRKNLAEAEAAGKRVQVLINERQALNTQLEGLDQQLFEDKQAALKDQTKDTLRQQDELDAQVRDVREKQEQINQPVAASTAPVPAKIAACWELQQVPMRATPESTLPKVAERVVPRVVVTPRTVATPVAAPVANTAPARPQREGPYFVQVGVFGPTNGVPVQERLKQMGLGLDVADIGGNNGRLLRIRVGPYATLEEAEQMVKRINETFSLSSAIVRM